MALPLPKVIPDTMAGGGLVTAMRGGNALAQDMYGTKIKQSEAEYAPWTNYANAASKIAYSNMLPYQMQATVMSNPMIWMALKDNPKALNALMQNLTQSMPTPEQMRGGTNMPPQPGQVGGTGHGLLNSLLGLMGITGQSQSRNPLAPMSQPQPEQGGGADRGYSYDANGNKIKASDAAIEQAGLGGEQPTSQPSVTPQGGPRLAPGGMPGVVNKMVAPYEESPFKPGSTVTNETGSFSTPDAASVQASQQAIQGIKNLKPILQDISKGAERWLKPGAKGKIAAGQLLGTLKQYFGTLGGIPDAVLKQFDIKENDVSDYAEWSTQQQKAVETYMKARQWPQDQVALGKVSKIIEPLPGEGKAYGERVTRELAQLENQLLPSYQQTLSQGFDLPTAGQTHTAIVDSISDEAPTTTKEAIQKGGEKFKSQLIKMKGIDPADGKMKVWNVPQGQAQEFLDAGFKRVN